MKSKGRTIKPLRLIAAGFAILIAVGTLLLMMPFSTISGESCGWEDALFTVTSASCVTGLVVQDTAEYWSPFGQVIILLCIQIGGLGVMMTTAALLLTTRRKITVSERMLIGQSISIDEISGVVRLARGVLIGTMAIEGVGAIILTLRFSRQFPFWDSLWKGIFHSVSAFCNAGFDLMGNNYEGLSSYVGDFTVSMTIAFLIIIGGLGFYVWNDVRAYKTKKKLSIHTKIVLFTTAALLVFGTIGFMVLEWNNPATIGNEGFGSKVIASFFQSTTTRTAGFDQMIQANMTPGSQALSCLLMFIGGSPGSTAGGIKTTTLIVILFTAISAMRGKSSTVVLQRTVPNKTVRDALAIVVVGVGAVAVSTFILTMVDSVSFESALFECISAFATVGLSRGITPGLSTISHLTLVGLMFLGRVGVMTLGLSAFMRKSEEPGIRMPDCKILL